MRQYSVTDLSAVYEDVAALIPAESSTWDEFLHWAARIYETEGFDETERDYKLVIAEKLAGVRRALESGGGDWLGELRSAFGPPNNLTTWRAHGTLLGVFENDPDSAERFLRHLWEADVEEGAELEELLSRWPVADQTPGNRLSLLSFLRLAVNPTELPIYRPTPVARARELLGLMTDGGLDPAHRYLGFVSLIDELRERLSQRGVLLRDRLDAQGVLWWVAVADPPESWESEERQAFLRWRGDVSNGDGHDVHLPAATSALADVLLLDSGWLQEILDLLNEKRQVIFYGPPGTGKTFVAQALAEHAASGGGAFELVQFHPAYGYEDFFEGYRPTLEDGLVAFELRPGPLRRLAEQARSDPEHPYLLVIDEINRGQIAKIFGELYFLLEYRDRAIRLQYSPADEFRFPENLFVIGTMNTADRSIALVDSALRRRFYFVPFLPSTAPLDTLLARWLEREEYPDDAARYLEALNATLARAGESEEFAVGPSYFITRGGAPDIERVWEHAIAPLLEERFFGARSPIEVRELFSPNTLLHEGESDLT
jgi:MoxR-like ATPase